MSLRIPRITAALILALLLASWLVSLRVAYGRLEQTRGQDLRRAQEERRLAELEADAARGNAPARQALHAQVLRARSEVGALERAAEESAARRQTQESELAAALAQNRDPKAGLTRLEYFRNVGRATPADAFQTLVWAVMKGDDSLPAMLAIKQGARQEAKALIAELPPASRAEYPTPEKLAALALSDLILKQTAAEIGDAAVTGPLEVELAVTFSGGDEGREKIPFQLGAGGWQVKLSTRQIGQLQRQLLQGR